LRPGEKLYDELFSENEKLVSTHHPKIMKVMKNEFEGDFEELTGELINSTREGDSDLIQNLIKVIVPELTVRENDRKLS
jgi:FlaA1/EpsC-like NDP-sugar epimerase